MTNMQLRHYLTLNEIDTRFFLKAAIRLTTLIGELHQQGINQLNVSPDNISYDPESGQLDFIDLSSTSSDAYMSPEQTGRIGRNVDHRSGLYRLGITFYEMLAGHLPFEAENNNEWVYFHLAVRPKPLWELRPEIPRAVCELVMKLLSKNAEERYQSAYSLQFDLERCSKEWEESEAIGLFTLGEWDKKSRFQLPPALYEREKELRVLLAMFERTSNGSKELFYISGRSGSGKTALIKEFQSRIVHHKGYFISGKFDQMKKEIPYTPIIQVLRELVRHVLSEDPRRISIWRMKLIETLGRSGRVITEVIPEAAFLLGEQKPLEALPSADAINRFKFLFMRFIKVFVDKERPLVLFFDDVQWADQASLDFIKLLAADPTNHYMAIIGAGRLNAWEEGPPIEEAISKFQKEIHSDIQTLHLEPLHLSSIAQILADSLQESRERVKALAEIIFQKTGGNPFYIKQYLHSIHSEKLLRFHMETGEWEWDLDQIKGREVRNDVIGLILERLNKLPEDTLYVLNVAGTIGNTFDLKTLSIVTAQKTAQIAGNVLPALREGLLLACKDPGPSGQETDNQAWEEPVETYTFLHDKVHEAVYNLMPEEQQKQLHLHIGRTLLENWSTEQKAERIFELVYHLNKGSGLIRDPAEQVDLAKLNLQAGIKAKASIAFASALGYFNMGIELIQRESVLSDDALFFRLLIERPECEYFCGYLEQADATIAELFERADDPLDRARIALIQVEMYAYLKNKKALSVGLKAMRELGLHIPTRVTKPTMLWKVVQSNFILNKTLDQLPHLHESRDPYEQVLADITMAVAASAVIEDPELSVMLFATYVMHGLKYGKTQAFPFILGSYATVLCLGFGRYRTGFRLAQIALQLAENYDNPKMKGRIHFIFGLILQYQHPNDSVAHFQKSSQFGLQSGDMNYVGFSMALLANNSTGDLNQLDVLCNEYFEAASRFLDSMIMRHLQIVAQYIAALRGLTLHRASFSNENFDETSLFKETESVTQKKQYFYYYACKIEVCYLFGYYEEALAWAKETETKSERTYSPVMVHKHRLYHYLSIVAKYPSASLKDKRIYLKLLTKQLREMKRWARSCPQSALHKYYLMDAEMQRLKGNEPKALNQYNLAIASAKEESLIQYEALGNELTAAYYLAAGNPTLAKAYMMDAAQKYRLWGATEKVKALCEAYPDLVPGAYLEDEPAEQVIPAGSAAAPSLKELIETNELSDTSIMNRNFDLNTILQARNIAPNAKISILEQFLNLAIVHAGAERGYIVQEINGEMIVEAELDKKLDREGRAHVVTDFDKGRHYSKAVVQYVIRTQESVVLGESSYGLFTADPYVERKQPKSILCMPIHYPGNFRGALYLENNLISDVFTADQTEILDIVLTRMLYLNTVRIEAEHQAPKAGRRER
ncbi:MULTISPECIES: AAA family ATPase [unclassified Paenibacillus]|uniref:AAA family ATPase n=1 Tax=unclassified Paenibacillus TaxID=185978 RepID=UPI001AE8F49E|nr:MULTISPECIES: AAA family ATPase [unclassified Paenibacillus]MBP1157611.1 putative ATPase/GAF domain-containing protein [Paenibacillus sp. PvP091]MBP1171652.1 putative ATPase/GAF domain-containing protein [Paenibacillus sp. PvR098]MBP2438033.1 putative ATPase/GAF domain-containing protein [Paenibacillus sp. PvP052]